MEVDPVQEGPGNLAQVFLDLVGRAGAFLGGVRVIPAGALLRCLSVVSIYWPKGHPIQPIQKP